MGGPSDTPRSGTGGWPPLGSREECSGQPPQATPPLPALLSLPLTQAEASARLCKETPTSKGPTAVLWDLAARPEAPRPPGLALMAGAGHGAEPGTCDHPRPGNWGQ